MKTSTKIWLIIFALSSVLEILLSKQILQGIIITDKIYFNFSFWGWLGLIFVVISTISSSVLFFRFLKSQTLGRQVFFSSIPVTAIFFGLSYYLVTINNYSGKEIEFVRAVLQVNDSSINKWLWLGLFMLIYLFILFVTIHSACRPIKKLEKAVSRLGNGHITKDIKIGGNKQFIEIEHSLNKINENLKQKENIIEKTNEEYEKFVPKQFLKFLGKNSVLDLELGNKVKKELTTLYIAINSNAVNHTLSLEDNFNFINSYLNVVSPIIRKYGGFVDKYVGDGILAVFIKAQNALDCASTINRIVEAKNRSSKMEPALYVTISVHTGDVVLGVVGEEERKSLGVIDDTFSIVSKMHAFAKFFGCKIVFSKRTLNSLKVDYPLIYRYVGALTLGDNEFISLFESLECYNKKTKEKFAQTKTIFEQGVRYFNLGKCHQAKDQFEQVLKLFKQDKVAYMYYNKCEQQVCGDAPLRIN